MLLQRWLRPLKKLEQSIRRRRQVLLLLLLLLMLLLPAPTLASGVKAAYMKQLLSDSLPPQWVPQIGTCSGQTCAPPPAAQRSPRVVSSPPLPAQTQSHATLDHALLRSPQRPYRLAATTTTWTPAGRRCT